MENVTTSLLLAPFAPLGVFLSWKLVNVIPQETFYIIVYLVLFSSGTKLIWDGLTRSGFI